MDSQDEVGLEETTESDGFDSETSTDSETSELPDQAEGDDWATTETTSSDTAHSGGDITIEGGDGGSSCGNGVIDDGEQCDGGNLGGFSCVDLGYSGGILTCDPVTCTYDASGCTTDTTTTSATSG